MLFAHIKRAWVAQLRNAPPHDPVDWIEVEAYQGLRKPILVPANAFIIQNKDDVVRVRSVEEGLMYELEETVEQLHAQLRGPLPVLHEGKRNPPPTEQEVKAVSAAAFAAQSDFAILRKRYEDLLASHTAQASRLANVLDALDRWPRVGSGPANTVAIISYEHNVRNWVGEIRRAALGKGPGE